MVSFRLISILSVVSFLHLCQAFLEPISLPPKLHDCYELKTNGFNESQVHSKEVQNFCMKSYLYSIAGSLWAPKISQGGWNYLSSLMRKLNKEIEGQKSTKKSRRQKRQIRTWRYRQEIRTLTPQQWRSVTNALTRLKRTPVDDQGQSEYDTLSFLHSGSVLASAHGGPNFPGWHRYYLLILETAMGVPLPYWDSTLDNDLSDPTLSILWSDFYFGNGDGDVVTGPFREWQTTLNTPLIRNIATDGSSLMTKLSVNLVLSRRRLVEITEPKPAEQSVYSLERHHNGPHNWVGGYIGRLQTAAWDPVFFFHHTFIDYIYEYFRVLQRRRGVNPSTDYPFNTPPGHEWLNVTNFLPFYGNVRNIEGVSEEIARLVAYQHAPECWNNCGNSPHITCDRSRRTCIPATSRAAESFAAGVAAFGAAPGAVPASAGLRTASRAAAESRGPLPAGPRFGASVFVDPRARNPALPSAPAADSVALSGDATRLRAASAIGGGRKKRSVKETSSPALQNTTVVSNQARPVTSDLDRTFQNTFMLDGVSDIKRWAFVPVRVIYKRPPGIHFKSHLYVNGHGVENTDMYAPWQNNVLSNSINSNNMQDLPRCKISGSGATKVYVATDGLDYLGQYTDYAIVDGRESKSFVMTYVGIKNPSLSAGRVLFTSFDSCEHSCRPTCLVPNSNPPVYQPCSGAFQITSSEPKMYSLTREDAKDSVWNFNGGISAPLLTFVCDYKAIRPWITEIPQV